MNVRETVNLGNGHRIEIGDATWNETQTSVRNRYPTANGGFSPRSSSELPLEDIEIIVTTVAQKDLLDISACARIIEALSASLVRRT